MKQLWSETLTNLSTTYNVESGKFRFIVLRFDGVAQSGITIALTDLGTVRLNNNGNDKVNLDCEALSEMADNYGGYVEASSVAGGAFAFSIFIPAGYWFDPKNVFWFGHDDEAYMQLQFPNLNGTNVASGNVTIYGKPGTGVQSYWHKLLSKQVVNSASNGTVTDKIVEKNIISVYLKDPASLIGNFILTRDGKVEVNGSIAAELALSNWQHQVESANPLYIAEFADNQKLADALSNSFQYQYDFIASGNLAQYYSSIEFTPDRQKASLGG